MIESNVIGLMDSYDCFLFSKFQKTFIVATFNVVLNVQTRPHMLGP
jgi:hypothetical protein